MNEVIVELLIERETDEDWFERFANDAVSYLEARAIANTHKTADLGSDGKTYDRRARTHVRRVGSG